MEALLLLALLPGPPLMAALLPQVLAPLALLLLLPLGVPEWA